VLERKVTVLQNSSDPTVIYADGWMSQLYPQLWSAIINGQRPACLYTVHEKGVVRGWRAVRSVEVLLE
jgi:hypothetical protein